MSKSATDVMQDIVFSSVVDAVAALRAASKGVPNAMLRDVNAIGPNTVLTDLSPEVQAAIATAVRNAFNRLRVEGYSVSPTDNRAAAAPPRPRPQGAPPRSGGPAGPGGGPRPGTPGGAPRPNGPGGNPRSRPGARPGRPPKPSGR